MKTNKLTLAGPSVVLIVIALIAFTSSTFAQTAYKTNGKSVITLNGTSTLHDWTMQANSFTTAAQFTLGDNNALSGINSLSLTLPVVNLKSSKDGLNENAWETLNYEDHKNIMYRLTSSRITPAGGNKYQIAATGNLTISGVTKPVTMNVTATVNADGSINCTGSLPIKLSQFNIERPSFMFGTMSVGDAMTLSYNVNFVK